MSLGLSVNTQRFTWSQLGSKPSILENTEQSVRPCLLVEHVSSCLCCLLWEAQCPKSSFSFPLSLILIINRKKSLVLRMGSGASFVIVLHQVWKKHPLHQDFLGLYTLDSDKLSEQTHGLLGMTSSRVFVLVFPYEAT